MIQRYYTFSKYDYFLRMVKTIHYDILSFQDIVPKYSLFSFLRYMFLALPPETPLSLRGLGVMQIYPLTGICKKKKDTVVSFFFSFAGNACHNRRTVIVPVKQLKEQS